MRGIWNILDRRGPKLPTMQLAPRVCGWDGDPKPFPEVRAASVASYVPSYSSTASRAASSRFQMEVLQKPVSGDLA